MIFNFYVFCPECGDELLITRYHGNKLRFDGECKECEKTYDIRLEEK